MVRLIVNADDLGMSREVNDAIFRSIDRGLVTSSTLLANGPAFADAAARTSGYPRVSFGVHLNATEFRPLTGHPGLRPLIDENGSFARRFFSTPMTRDLASALAAEWTAQVELVRSAGVAVSHLDSHHLIHVDLKALRVIREVLRRTGVHRVRPIHNLSLDMHRPRRRLGNLKRRAWRLAAARGLGLRMVDGFAEFATVWRLYEDGKLPVSLVEGMVHPGHPGFAEETELLESLGPEIERVERISYHEL